MQDYFKVDCSSVAGDPALEEAYSMRSSVHVADKNLEAAIRDLSRLIEIAPKKTAQVYFNRANCYHKLGKHEEAIKDCAG